MPKVTVICGFYNRAHLVRRTLVGLRNQTYLDCEFYIFDDSSTDETFRVIQEFVRDANDPRFRIVRHDENIGFTRGLIKAVSTTSSEFIAIHDSGDYSESSRLEKQVKALEEDQGLVVVGCHYINYIEEFGIHRIRRPNANSSTRSSLVKDPTFTHGEVMFKRSAYVEAGGYRPQFKFAQDNDLWLRMIDIGRFATIPETLYVRCVQFDGISYMSESFSRQSSFYVLGKLIALGEVPVTSMNVLAAGGDVSSVLAKHDPRVQKVILRGALRALAFGGTRSASEIAANHIYSKTSRWLISLVAGILSSCAGKALQRSFWRACRFYKKSELLDSMRRDGSS